MNLTRFPRRHYTPQRPPIEAVPRFSGALGGPHIHIKRDDLLGLSAGGNKTRKLEFLVADALAQGADTLITCGAVQSNHCRLTLSAAVKEGMKCRLVLEEQAPGSFDPASGGNIFLFHLLGVEDITVVPRGADLTAAMEAMGAELAAHGRKGYMIPVGGSNPVGATGYVACAQEIMEQTFEMGLGVDAIICASGSAGTQAGLVTGCYGCNMNIPVLGINVGAPQAEQEELVYALAQETARHVGVKSPIPREAVTCLDGFVGPGYSIPTPEMAEAVKLMARTEGILLDPVYTGKAMAGLMALVREGRFNQDDHVLFLHTGGTPALEVYKDYILSH